MECEYLAMKNPEVHRALFKTLFIRAILRTGAHLTISHDTPRPVTKSNGSPERI
jgi:hypothetical protein